MTQTEIEMTPHVGEANAGSLVDQWAKSRIFSRLQNLTSGSITLLDGGESHQLGDARAPLQATVTVLDSRFYRDLALGGALGGAEAYMDGYWTADDLSCVIRILAQENEGGVSVGAARWRKWGLSGLHALRRNTRSGSRRNIAAHYDLGNEFFELFLDPTLTYSSGIFETPESSMEEASIAKYERLCKKLRLGPDDHVLEIGTGWGGFAVYAAGRYGCRITTTTISERQYERACERVDDAKLSDRVDVLFEDYRDLSGRYDKLVSIEMVEAVGHEKMEEFF